ncbi:MAG: glycosyltransferase [Anaerolineae bacterium]
MNSEQPFISVIIPTYGRNGQLMDTLNAFLKQTYPSNRFEILIVNDGSPEPLDLILKPFQNQLDLTLIIQENAGPAVARNSGAAQAKGEILAFTDDDCCPDSEWLAVIAASINQFLDHAVGGRTQNMLVENLFSTASQLLVDYLYRYYNANHPQARFFTTNNLAVTAVQFLEVGGFHPEMPLAAGEDREFCDRWLFHGFEMHYAGQAVINHAHPLTFVSYLKQHFRYGRGAYLFHIIRSQRQKQAIRVEPIAFYLRLLLYPWQEQGGLKAIALAFLLALSQAANVLGFFWQGFRIKRDKNGK